MDVGLIRAAAVKLDGEQDVFLYIEDRDQVVALEYEADFSSAEDGEGFFLEGKYVFFVYQYFALRGAVQAAEHVEQCGFSAAGGADDGGEGAILNL